MYILWLVFFKDKLHVHLNVDIRCIQLHINLHVIECVQRVFDDSCIKSPKGRMESGCFDLKSGHFCQKIVGESNSKTDFALMFAKWFPLLFFLQGVVFCPIMDGARNFAQYSQGPKKRGFLELKNLLGQEWNCKQKNTLIKIATKQLSGAHPVPCNKTAPFVRSCLHRTDHSAHFLTELFFYSDSFL